MKALDYTKITNVELADVHAWDFPDYSDAHIVYAEYDGVPMTEEQLDLLNEDAEFVHDKIIESI